MSAVRLAVLVSHPIQYFAPWYAAAAGRSGLDPRVFFCCDWGVQPYHDPDFDRTVTWDVPLLEGYEHEFLPISRRPRHLAFTEVDNPGVGAALERFRPEVLLLHGYAHRTHWRATAWAAGRGVPTMIVSDSDARARRAAWKRITKALVVGLYYRRLDGAWCTGEGNREYHRSFGLPDERIFPGLLPVDGPRLRADAGDIAAARSSLRRRLGIGAGEFVALFCGKLIDRKRPLDLPAAVRVAAGRGVAVRALVAGDGPLRGPVTEALADLPGVCMGFVPQRDLAGVYAAADVLVLPSEREAHGLVITEAGAMGVPAIVSDRVGAVGPGGAAQAGKNVVVVPCGDTDALADALVSLAGDEARRSALARGARRMAEEREPSRAATLLEDAATALRALGPRRRGADVS